MNNFRCIECNKLLPIGHLYQNNRHIGCCGTFIILNKNKDIIYYSFAKDNMVFSSDISGQWTMLFKIIRYDKWQTIFRFEKFFPIACQDDFLLNFNRLKTLIPFS